MVENFIVLVSRAGATLHISCEGDREKAKELLRKVYPGCSVTVEGGGEENEEITIDQFNGMTFDEQ